MSSATAPRPAGPSAGPTYYPHQMGAIRFAYSLLQSQGGAYIRHDVGMGKTLTAITLARLLAAERILVVTTKAGLGVWRAEFGKWCSDTKGSGLVPTILNYDRLTPPTIKSLLKERWDLLVLDESQKAKTPRAARTKAVKKLRDVSAHVLLLSGTPAHTPLDYWAQFRLIAPNERPWCFKFSEYKQYVCKLGGPYNQWVTGYRPEAVAEVEAEIGRWMHVAVKSELQLPEAIRMVVPVELSEPEKRAYQLMEQRLRIELPKDREATAPIVLTKILRLQQITSGFLTDTQGTDHPIGSAKVDTLMDLLEEREDQKVVVAYRYAYEAASILAAFGASKRPVRMINGHTSDKQRTERVKWFQEDDHHGVLLLQAQAGGTSITLTKAGTLIKYAQLSSVIDDTQLEGRVHRIGTTTNVQIIDLIAPGTVEQDLYDARKANADLVSLVSLLKRRLGV